MPLQRRRRNLRDARRVHARAGRASPTVSSTASRLSARCIRGGSTSRPARRVGAPCTVDVKTYPLKIAKGGVFIQSERFIE